MKKFGLLQLYFGICSVLSTLSVFSCLSVCKCERKLIPSVKSDRVVSPHTSPIGRSLVALFITQSMITRIGEMTHPCLTPVFMWNHSLYCLSCLTQHRFSACIHIIFHKCLSPFLEGHMPVVSSCQSSVHFIADK